MSFGVFCCCKQKTAYEMRISDWSSDVCSSDLVRTGGKQYRVAAGDKIVVENQPVDVNAGQMDLIGIEGAHGHDFLDLGDADLARGRHRLVEVARGLAEQQVAVAAGKRTGLIEGGGQIGRAHV